MARRLAWLALPIGLGATVAVVVWAGGCGGALPAVIASGRVVRFHLDEYRITPTTVRVRNGRLKLVATDTGVLTHNLRIEAYRNDSQGNPIVLGTTRTAHPGETVFVRVRLGPGTYRLVCTIGDHVDLGQRATLIAG
jgi:acetyltransferase-like isoleucine patch superfamily enzyme